MGDPKDLNLARLKMIEVQREHGSYAAMTPADPHAYLNDPQGKYLTSEELFQSPDFSPALLDGNPDTYSTVEEKTWAHFSTKHGTLSPYGDYVFSREELYRNLTETKTELKTIYQYYCLHPNPFPQWVYLKVEDWDAFLKQFAMPPKSAKQFKIQILDQLQKYYTTDKGPLNIHFSFVEPKEAKNFKTIYIGTKPESTGGSFLVGSRKQNHIRTALETIQCMGIPFRLPSLSQIRNPKLYLLVLMKIGLMRYSLDNPSNRISFNDVEAEWTSKDATGLKQLIPHETFPQSEKDILAWLATQEREILQGKQEERIIYKSILAQAASGLLLEHMQKQKGSGKSEEIIYSEMIKNPVVKELLGLAYFQAGSALWGCGEANYGNQSLEGLMVVTAEGNNAFIKSPKERLNDMIKVIAHETGHMLGLQHHFITGIENSEKPVELIMVAGGWRNDLATVHAFLPEEQRYLEFFLGLKKSSVK